MLTFLQRNLLEHFATVLKEKILKGFDVGHVKHQSLKAAEFKNITVAIQISFFIKTIKSFSYH